MYRILNESGTYNTGNRFKSYRFACILASELRRKLKDDTIGVVSIKTGRFVSEVIRPL